MKIDSKVTTSITLTLEMDVERARYLMVLMQNPHCDPRDEAANITDFRRSVFQALQSTVPQ